MHFTSAFIQLETEQAEEPNPRSSRPQRQIYYTLLVQPETFILLVINPLKARGYCVYHKVCHSKIPRSTHTACFFVFYVFVCLGTNSNYV